MPQYVPPPASLDHLNPIQRYLQKGSLDFEDYMRLFLLVLAYFVLRPYIDAGMKRFFKHEDLSEGEEIQKEYIESKLKAKVGANEIRGAKTTAVGSSTETITSGADIKPTNTLVNRKAKETGEVPAPTAEQLLEWSDITTTGATEGAKTDVLAWVDKWDE
jgi:Protein trafficking PGA2